MAALVALVGVGSLVLTVGGLTARRIPPSVLWWLQPVAILLPVAASAAGAVGVIAGVSALWTGRTGLWVVAALHIVVAGVAFWRLMGGVGLRADVEEGPVLRVLTLNAAFSRRGEVDAIGRRFGSVQPHLIALQEVSIRPHLSDGGWVAQGAGLALLTDSTYTLTTLEGPPSPHGWLTNGTALFTRLPASRSKPVLLDTVSAENSGRYTRTEIDWDGEPVAIYNVHFRSFTAPRPWAIRGGLDQWGAALRASGHDFVAREAEARKLKQALDSETIPFLVVGDFNATPDHWTYAHVAEGLVDALDASPGLAATYPDVRPLVRIDAILASPDWVVRRATVQPPGMSDHRPVMAELQRIE